LILATIVVLSRKPTPLGVGGSRETGKALDEVTKNDLSKKDYDFIVEYIVNYQLPQRVVACRRNPMESVE